MKSINKSQFQSVVDPHLLNTQINSIDLNALERDGFINLTITTDPPYTTYHYIKSNRSTTTITIHNTLIPIFMHNYAGYPALWYTVGNYEQLYLAKKANLIKITNEHLGITHEVN